MKLKLTKTNRIDGKAGDIVEVSPDRAKFLLEFGMAEPVLIREQMEAPEKKTAEKRETRAAKAEPEEPKKTARAARKKA